MHKRIHCIILIIYHLYNLFSHAAALVAKISFLPVLLFSANELMCTGPAQLRARLWRSVAYAEQFKAVQMDKDMGYRKWLAEDWFKIRVVVS